MNELAPSTDRMTVAIVSRNYLVRLGLQTVLNDQPNIRLIGEASSIPEAGSVAAPCKRSSEVNSVVPWGFGNVICTVGAIESVFDRILNSSELGAPRVVAVAVRLGGSK